MIVFMIKVGDDFKVFNADDQSHWNHIETIQDFEKAHTEDFDYHEDSDTDELHQNPEKAIYAGYVANSQCVPLYYNLDNPSDWDSWFDMTNHDIEPILGKLLSNQWGASEVLQTFVADKS